MHINTDITADTADIASITAAASDHRPYQVYLRRHKKTRKIYIGYTSMGVRHRFTAAVWNAINGKGKSLIDAALRASPEWTEWDHHILAVAWSLAEAERLEEFWIDAHGSRDPRKGLNVARGGRRGMVGLSRDPESIAKAQETKEADRDNCVLRRRYVVTELASGVTIDVNDMTRWCAEMGFNKHARFGFYAVSNGYRESYKGYAVEKLAR